MNHEVVTCLIDSKKYMAVLLFCMKYFVASQKYLPTPQTIKKLSQRLIK